jgi:hypothetical protein
MIKALFQAKHWRFNHQISREVEHGLLEIFGFNSDKGADEVIAKGKNESIGYYLADSYRQCTSRVHVKEYLLDEIIRIVYSPLTSSKHDENLIDQAKLAISKLPNNEISYRKYWFHLEFYTNAAFLVSIAAIIAYAFFF